jgi:hypothetical protein
MNDLLTLAEAGGGYEETLAKALVAGYGTDSAQFTGGRALIPENIEGTMVNAMIEQKEDCKMMNMVKKTNVSSTVHEYNRRTDVGDFEFRSVGEGGEPEEGTQSIERVTRMIKYISEYREITEQMVVVDTFENAYEAEKLAGTLNILKSAEYQCFHGDSSVNNMQFNGLVKQIKDVPLARRNVKDYRGSTIGSQGKAGIVDLMRMIYEQGGAPQNLFFPPVLATDIQELAQNSYRILSADKSLSPLLDTLPTPYGTVKFGDEAGADKFFRVRGIVSPRGNAKRRPNAPDSVTAATASDSASKFFTADAGDYLYTVHAIDDHGISAATAVSAAVAVAAGRKVTLTITPAANNPGTGFIICRSAKDGTETMEMARIGLDMQNSTTLFADLNDDLPGTADMLLLTENKLQSVIDFYQLLPLRLYNLPPTRRLTRPMVIALWGALDLKVPEWCGIIKNVSYQGGLY